MTMKRAARIFYQPQQIITSEIPSHCRRGTWFKVVHDPDGRTNFYGLMSAQSFKSADSLLNWLPGTRFRKYQDGESVGEYVVRENGEGNEMVRM